MTDKVTGADLEELSLKELREIVRKLQELLSEEQKQKFQEIVKECRITMKKRLCSLSRQGCRRSL